MDSGISCAPTIDSLQRTQPLFVWLDRRLLLSMCPHKHLCHQSSCTNSEHTPSS